MAYSCSKGKGVYEFCVIWVKHQKVVKYVGHDIQMTYYLTLTTHIQVLGIYWMIGCQLGHKLKM